MQYTGLAEVMGREPPTYGCVGAVDDIADWRTMERRARAKRTGGTDAEIEVFAGLPRSFGLGTGMAAAG